MAKPKSSPRVTSKTPRVMYAASEYNANIYYATKFWAPDPFLFLQKDGRKSILLSKLEYDRGKKETNGVRVIPLDRFDKKARKRLGVSDGEPMAPVESIVEYLKDQGVKRAAVPADFPLKLARDLGDRGIQTIPVDEPFIPERECKSAEEIRFMQRALRITETGFARAEEVLRETKIRKSNKRLFWNGAPLTSEVLRGEIEATIARGGGVASGTIVAGGNQACDPHERGSGPLSANQMIILDIFPRDKKTGYYGDMTRTVLKGKASEAQKKLWDVVLGAEKKAIRDMKPGIHGKEVYEGTVDFFKKAGYATKVEKGRHVGFFHGLGHGLGLEVHEPLRIRMTDPIRAGMIFTIEPGLYYPGLGGCRHEDVGVVTEKGFRVLSKYPKQLEIR